MARISINNMSFFAYHGCFKEEQLTGTHFRVDISFDADTKHAEQSDKLEDTINYVTVYQVIKKEMEQNSALLEHVTQRILTAVQKNFTSILNIEVTLAKMNPPLGGKIGEVSITLNSND